MKNAQPLAHFFKNHVLTVILILVITFLHYSHESHIHELHGVFKLFFFIPIILGGFRGGILGGLVISSAVLLVFIPHAFLAACGACGSTADKLIEMVLYLGVGILTGTFSEHLMNARNQLQKSLEEKSAMEAELLRSTRLAAVGRLSAGLAHEIRNPLASIQGSAELLADDFTPDHPKGRMLGILMEEAVRLNTVLTRFLEFARSHPGDRGEFDLLPEAETVAEMIRHNPSYPDVECQVEAEVESCPAFGNRDQIRQVLLNLGLNAAAAAPAKSPVLLSLGLSADQVVCRVDDCGPGFTPEALENFGTPFFSTKNQGTGLGLATSLKIVQDQGGTLEPDQNPAGGGRVTMILPRARS